MSDKLKQRLLKIKVGHGDDKNADMSYPNDCNLNDHVKKARSLGIEVYQPQTTKEDTFQPTLIIGKIKMYRLRAKITKYFSFGRL